MIFINGVNVKNQQVELQHRQMQCTAHCKEKTEAQRQNHPLSWHRRAMERLEVNSVGTALSPISACSQSDTLGLLLLLGTNEPSAAHLVIVHLRKR